MTLSGMGGIATLPPQNDRLIEEALEVEYSLRFQYPHAAKSLSDLDGNHRPAFNSRRVSFAAAR